MLSERFLTAMQLSFSLHKDQVRKGTEVPYFSHIMSVVALVQEAGGDEDAQIGALLHDAVEDQGGKETLQLIRDQFGDSVAEIVLFCSDSVERDENGEKLPWRVRKEAHLQHLKDLDPASLTDEQRKGVLVMIADKLHNARATYESVLADGDSAYERFRGGKEGMLWYLRASSRALARLSGKTPIARHLRRAVDSLRDDHSAWKKMIRLQNDGYTFYYDASTPLLEHAAQIQIFEDLNRDGFFRHLADDDYLNRQLKELQELKELKEVLDKKLVPSVIVYDVTRQVACLPQKIVTVRDLESAVNIYRKASSGDKDAARDLVGRLSGEPYRQASSDKDAARDWLDRSIESQVGSPNWNYEMMRTSSAEE